MPRSPRHRPPRRGFTFVELVLVVMVLGIMAGVAAPRYQAALVGFDLTAATKELAAHLRYARQQAINQSASVGIEFNATAGTYRAVAVGGRTLDDPDHPGQPLFVQLGGNTGSVGLTYTGGGTLSLSFDMHGDCPSDGEVTLTTPGKNAVVRWNTLGDITVAL